MTHASHPLPGAEREAIPVAIPVGILVDSGSTHGRRRPERRGRLAPPHSMLLPAFESTPPPAPPADAWWLSAEEWVAPKPADRAPAASAEEPRVSRWVVGMVWSVFAGLMVAGFLVGGWLVDQIARARPPQASAAAARTEPEALAIVRKLPSLPAEDAPAPPAARPAVAPEALVESVASAAPVTLEPSGTNVARPAQPAPARPAPAVACAEQGGACAVAGAGKYGTSVDFVADPGEAARRALKEKKLLFVMHISGNFEDDQFT